MADQTEVVLHLVRLNQQQISGMTIICLFVQTFLFHCKHRFTGLLPLLSVVLLVLSRGNQFGKDTIKKYLEKNTTNTPKYFTLT